MAKVKKASAKNSVAALQYCVYIGPSIRGVVRHGQILSGGISDAAAVLADAIERFPLIRRLIVTGDKLPEANQLVKTRGNALYDASTKLVKQISKY